jgi:cysteinyl-tRNA synthetase
VLSQYRPETVRFFLVRAHYRSDLGYSDVHLNDAESSLKRLYTALSLVPVVEAAARASIDWSNTFAHRFKSAMDEDFGTPGAVAVLFELAQEINKTRSSELAGLLKALGGTLGLLQDDKFLQSRVDTKSETNSGSAQAVDIEGLIAQRANAKLAKNFAEADRIRLQLLSQGIVLKDSPTGTTWEVK